MMRYYDIIQPANVWLQSWSGYVLYYGGIAFVAVVILWAFSEEFRLHERAKYLYDKFFKKE
jgi:hypothetical protein